MSDFPAAILQDHERDLNYVMGRLFPGRTFHYICNVYSSQYSLERLIAKGARESEVDALVKEGVAMVIYTASGRMLLIGDHKIDLTESAVVT